MSLRRRPAPAATGLVLLCLACTAEHEPGVFRPYPPRLSGPELVLLGDTAEVEVFVQDADGGELRVFLAWGDGDTSDYGEFVPSGRAVEFQHRYAAADTYFISARCHDMVPLFSDWSSPRRVVVADP